MDIKDVWNNYKVATDIWVQLDWNDGKGQPGGKERYRIHFLKCVAKLSLEAYFDKIEQELW